MQPQPTSSPTSPRAQPRVPLAGLGLRGFVDAAHARVRKVVDQSRFHVSQRELLLATVERAAAGTRNPFGHPLSVPYLIAQAHGCAERELLERVGAFSLLYILALDLFDDVQDEDLEGKPHAQAGPAIAINSAIALSFLAQRELHGALPSLPAHLQPELLAIADEAALDAVSGQHLDLMGAAGACTPADVLRMHQGKTSSAIMLAELGALVAGCDASTRAHYRLVGEHMAQLVQVRDDLRDIFGKEVSPDLATGKLTYPLACFLEHARDDQRQQLEALRKNLPTSIGAIRTLLYDSGAIQRSAEALEHSRRTIHRELVAVDDAVTTGHHRLLLDVVDELAGGVYPVPAFAPSAALRQPGTLPHAARVVQEMERLKERLSPLGLPADLPVLRPWHQAHWMYVPAKHTIFFPDLDELGDEILPFQAELLGADTIEEPRALLIAQVPLVLAHELFHFWRDAAGRLTSDHWHEEWAANCLSVAYAATYEPAALQLAGAIADRVTARFPEALGAESERLLDECQHARDNTTGYGVGLLEVAVVTLEMVKRLAALQPELHESVATLLGASPVDSRRIA